MMCDLAHFRGEGTSFAQIFLICRSSVMIRWTSVFGSPTSSAIKRHLKIGAIYVPVQYFSIIRAVKRKKKDYGITLMK